MLRDLHITDLGVIDDAHLEVAPGLNVLTGETGAGKTMVVDALTLLLGERAAGAAVRAGRPAAMVEARLEVDGVPGVLEALSEAGVAPEDGEVLVARQVQASGRSRAQLQGRMATAAQLAELVGGLVEIHGQHEFQTLLRPGVQRDLLDRFAGREALELRGEYGRVWHRLRRATAELEALRSAAADRAREAELLGYQLGEIQAAEVRVGELEELLEEAERLGHAETLTEAATLARGLLAGDEDTDGGAASAAAQAARQLSGAGGHDQALDELATRTTGIAAELADLASDLRAYAEGVQADPVRLAEVTERIALLRDLERKYGEDIAAVLAFAEQAGARLAELDGGTERAGVLEEEVTRLQTELETTGMRLTQVRTASATRLADAVAAELAELNMGGARFQVAVTPEVPSAEGADRVELQLAANPGLPMRPLAKAASGGELSRVMLALRVVLAGVDRPATIVFDEVDAGVGGQTAAALGRRLAALARVHQILVVTHLPQIAAFADRHFVVEKQASADTTRTSVHTLADAGRRTELSRMLSGSPESDLAQAHAEELLAAAAASKLLPDREGGR